MLLNPLTKASSYKNIPSIARFLEDLPCYPFDVQSTAPVEEVVKQLQEHPELPGVLIREHKKFVGVLSRVKILEWLGRPFGIELFFKKPIHNLSANLNLTAEIYSSYMRINEAVERALSRPKQIMYEPIAVAFGHQDLRLLDMHVLLLAQSRLLANANQTIAKQVEIGKVLSSTLEVSSVLSVILEQMDAIVPYSRTAVMLYRDGKMDFAASRGFPPEVDMAQAQVMVNASPIFKNVIESRKATTVDDAASREDWQHIPGTPPTRSWLGVPLLHADKILGMLSISRLTVRPFTFDEMEAAQLFASQASIALGNANLYDKVKLFNSELENRVRERTRDLEKTYQKLELLDRNKSDFIKIASHEIKTPITVAAGYAQMLTADPSLAPRTIELAKGVTDGMKRLEEIVGTMLDVARLDSNEMNLVFRDIELQPLLLGVQASLEQQITQRKIAFSVQNMERMPRINADSDALQKALAHIVINAIKYTPDGGKIAITARAPGLRSGKSHLGTIRLSCADTGVGIDPKEQDLIFDKFYQTGKVMQHSSGKTKFKGGGPGLGLAVARGIIEAHGGQIWAESPGYDEETYPGSVFHIILPAQKVHVRL